MAWWELAKQVHQAFGLDVVVFNKGLYAVFVHGKNPIWSRVIQELLSTIAGRGSIPLNPANSEIAFLQSRYFYITSIAAKTGMNKTA